MPDVNVHVGCHGIFENAAEAIKKLASDSPEIRETNLITNRQYRLNWRDACLSGELSAIAAAQSGPLMNSIREEETTLHLLSNARILGDDNSIVEKRQLYPRAEQRVSSLMKVLSGCDVHLKIFISELEIFEHRNRLPPGLLKGLSSAPWADLIHRIVAEVPTIPVHVFALSDPTQFVRSLPEILFDPPIGKNSHVEGAINHLIDSWWDLGTEPPPTSHQDQYQRDLSAIASLAGVHLSVL